MLDVNDLIATALAEEGYLEKKSCADLDSRTANAGKGNYTKYGRDLLAWLDHTGDTFGVAYAWCLQFVVWCFIQTWGKQIAYELLAYCWSAYTPVQAAAFEKQGRLRQKPELGALIFFADPAKASSSRPHGIYHVGLVIGYDADRVYTIEGNTSSAAGVVENGGCVRRKSYSRSYSRIYGYGVPNFGNWILGYSEEEAVSATLPGGKVEEMDKDKLVKAVYRGVLGREADESGLKTWTAALEAGMEPGDMVDQITASVEHEANARRVREDLIRLAYMRLLGREPRDSEVGVWADTDKTVDEIIYGIEHSREYRARQEGTDGSDVAEQAEI